MDVLRTPEQRFAALPGFPYEPSYREWRGLRLAHVDIGDSAREGPIVLLHGEPSWSYLWRDVIAELVAAGHRCIAPDLPGFGRSDKPTDGWYDLERHTDAIASLFTELDLHDVTLVVHDFGGPIGLGVATGALASRISRIVAMDTGVLTGEHDLGPQWHAFRDHVLANDDLQIGELIAANCRRRPTPEVIAAYDAPFPSSEYKAGPRAFPRLVPLSADAPWAAEGRATAAALIADARPALLLWADSDPIIPLETVGTLMGALFPTAGDPHVIEDAGHFLQEDQGRRIGELIADWLSSPPARAANPGAS